MSGFLIWHRFDIDFLIWYSFDILTSAKSAIAQLFDLLKIMPARSKRSKANREISRKKYRVDPQVDVEEPELNKPLGNHDFAEDLTQAEYVGTESESQPPNAKLVYFAEADKSLKRTIYTGGSKRTQRR
ncbi:hypothetical protein POJ06DRAFT_302887 [Lipomyces tetrasporus]|uniref:Uncharacterized protein n=1 Tax=Lipomyces tetrasporus TaxID=54092 RepID=A0AAD7QNC1_9ASCO|nr:uncharacterized protein POJ06DRAFT_302887 [Lipomyces tetrasporus]KAJ8098175.1 hypothetical protein POJ06DRAFT_302887 [Lipomyces tetrasporus]